MPEPELYTGYFFCACHWREARTSKVATMLAQSEVVQTDPEILAREPVFAERAHSDGLGCATVSCSELQSMLAIVGLRNRIQDLRPLLPRILQGLTTIQPGQLVTITRR